MDPMQLAAIAATPTMPPAQPALRATFTWEAGNHLFDDEYALVPGGVTSLRPTAFDDAVTAARELVRAGEHDVPTFGRLSPVHAVLAVAGGFVPVTLLTANGKQMPIDGEIANGRGGAVLRGLTIDRTWIGGSVAALVGTSSLVDLRDAPTTSTWWRSSDPGREPGPWTRR
jgi:hypothetical protein